MTHIILKFCWAIFIYFMANNSLLAENLVFKDLVGKEIVLDKSIAKRIVSIPIPSASSLISLDGNTKKLVGMHPKSKSALEGGILEEFFPNALKITDKITTKGFTPNLEVIMSLYPDLVWQWASQGKTIDAMEKAGLKVAAFQYGTEDWAREILLMIGKNIGKEEKAKEAIAWRDETMAKIKSAIGNVKSRPKVLYCLRCLNGYKVGGAKTYNHFYIDMAGGVNVAKDLKGEKSDFAYKMVDAEQILQWNPDVILLNGFEKDLSVDDIYNDKRFAELSAVKQKRVYKLPLGGYRWDPPSQESPLTWMWLANILHPQKANFNVREEIKDKYKFLYGKVPSDKQISEILLYDMNKKSAHYAKKFAAN